MLDRARDAERGFAHVHTYWLQSYDFHMIAMLRSHFLDATSLRVHCDDSYAATTCPARRGLRRPLSQETASGVCLVLASAGYCSLEHSCYSQR